MSYISKAERAKRKSESEWRNWVKLPEAIRHV